MKKYYKVHFFKNANDYYQNLSEWDAAKQPLLYILGLSGSGKTTLSQIIKLKENACLISLDALKFYEFSDDESKHIVDKFVAQYPHIRKYIDCNWKVKQNFIYNEHLFTECIKLFDLFLFEHAIKNKRKYIVEGIQPFVRFPPRALMNKPRIIKGTSSINSYINAYKRDKPSTVREIMFRFLRYSMIQFIRLNIYITFWEINEN